MRQNPHVRICGGPGSATTLVYPTFPSSVARLNVYWSRLKSRAELSSSLSSDSANANFTGSPDSAVG